jgi:hypothetical protein
VELRYPVEELLRGDRWFLGELRIGPEPLQDVRPRCPRLFFRMSRCRLTISNSRCSRAFSSTRLAASAVGGPHPPGRAHQLPSPCHKACCSVSNSRRTFPIRRPTARPSNRSRPGGCENLSGNWSWGNVFCLGNGSAADNRIKSPYHHEALRRKFFL